MILSERYADDVQQCVGLMVLSYIIIAALADAFPINNFNRGVAIVQIIFIYVIQMAYAGALGPCAWIYASEIFPTHLRDKGVNISQAGQQITTLWVNQTWPVMFASVGHNAYWILVCINALGCAMVAIFWPESKSRWYGTHGPRRWLTFSTFTARAISLEHMDKVFGEVDKVEAFVGDQGAGKQPGESTEGDKAAAITV